MANDKAMLLAESYSVMKNNDMKGVLGFRANLECRFGN